MLNEFNEIEAIDVYFEKIKIREFAGRLSYKDSNFIFTYSDAYLYNKRSISLGPDLPLSKKEFISAQLFPTFSDRIPSKENPAYKEYCKMTGIDVSEKRPFVLLATIGSKGPSSFIFAPVFKETFSSKDVVKFREYLKLTVREFGELFDFSPNTIYAIENNKSSGQDALKRFEIYYCFPEVALRAAMRNHFKINDKKSNYVEEFFLSIRLIKQTINDSQYKWDIVDFCEIQPKPYASLCIGIDAAQPAPNRPNKRSKKLVFCFKRELMEDGVLKNHKNYQMIKNKVKEIFKTFDFINKAPKEQPVPIEFYIIKSDCSVTALGSSTGGL